MSKAISLNPTSDLPFAADRGDVPHLDWVKNYRSERVERALRESSQDDGLGVSCAWALVTAGDRLSKIGELLAAVESLFEKAHRGDASEQSPRESFGRAMSLLGLSRELLEVLGFDTDDELERVCKGIADVPEPAVKTGEAKSPN